MLDLNVKINNNNIIIYININVINFGVQKFCRS